MRRHSSGPSISGMYQSEITRGMRVSWSSFQASRPLSSLLTSYPAAFASAPSWALDTASSSTTSTEIALAILPAFRRRPKVIERGLRLTAYLLKLVTRAGHVAVSGCALHVLEQRRQTARADRPGGRLEGMRGPLQRLGLGVAGRRGEGIQALRHGRHEGLEDPVNRFGGPWKRRGRAGLSGPWGAPMPRRGHPGAAAWSPRRSRGSRQPLRPPPPLPWSAGRPRGRRQVTARRWCRPSGCPALRRRRTGHAL